MSRGGRDDGDDPDRAALRRALAGVKPLAGRDARVPPRRAKPAPHAPASGAGAHTEPGAGEPFVIVSSGERLEGFAAGIDRAWLRRLRSGDVAVEERLDLHGLTARTARAAVTRALLAAHEAGRRCVLVVHGRGARSAEGPVLKAFLLRWLTEARVAPLVMAFSSARPEHGGAGATYVLLRRRRAEPAR